MFGKTFSTVVLVVFLAAIISIGNSEPKPKPKAKANPNAKAKAKPQFPFWGYPANVINTNSKRGDFGTGHNIGMMDGDIGNTWGANQGGVNNDNVGVPVV